MAEGGCPLWSETNVDQEGAVCLNPELLNQIVQKSADVIQVMEVRSLWPHLLQYGVINEEKQEELKVDIVVTCNMDISQNQQGT